MSLSLRFQNFLQRYRMFRAGQSTFREYICFCADRLFSRNFMLYPRARARRMSDKGVVPIVRGADAYHIRDVKLPLLDPANERLLNAMAWEDTFWSYVLCDDKYDEETFDRCDKIIGEGLYGLVNDKVNVTVEAGDIVIDAGSWIGDFAAYASVKGATTYAFEPVDDMYKYVVKTSELNKNIIPVKKGLSDKSTVMEMFTSGNSTATFLSERKRGTATAQVDTITIDDFVRENHLPRVDFIKADIEGFERHMLAGAQDTLARFAPKLALCTYHLPDDPQVMAELILRANPKYNIVQKRKKLFASVPE